MEERPVYVAFCSKYLEEEFKALDTGSKDERLLHNEIAESIRKLKLSPTSGARVQKKSWPAEVSKRYRISNMWRLEAGKKFSITYTIKTNEYSTVIVIIRLSK
jgi:hypothetical protein